MATKSGHGRVSRRRFMQGAAAAGLAAGSAHILRAAPIGTGTSFKVGLIGCGGRGGGAIGDHLRAAKALDKALNLGLQCTPWAFADWSKGKAEGQGNRYGVPKERCFGGADGYRKLIGSGVDIVLMAQPPVFRPLHFEACVEAGKHVFFEKPAAVDAPGCVALLHQHLQGLRLRCSEPGSTPGYGENRAHFDRFFGCSFSLPATCEQWCTCHDRQKANAQQCQHRFFHGCTPFIKLIGLY